MGQVRRGDMGHTQHKDGRLTLLPVRACVGLSKEYMLGALTEGSGVLSFNCNAPHPPTVCLCLVAVVLTMQAIH